MGYVRERTVYRLVFADDEYAGLQVTARSASVAAYQRIAELADLAEGEYTHPLGKEDRQRVDDLFAAFAEQLVEWNLEEPVGVPVPATLEGLKSQDYPFVLAIILAWMDAVAGVSRPLATPSSDGEQSLVESMPMDVLSPSP